MKQRISPLFILLFIFFAAGCITIPEKREVIGPKPVTKAPRSLPPELLDKRIRALTTVSKDASISDRDKEIASGLLDGYKSLRRTYSGQLTEEEYSKSFDSLFSSLSRIDENYFPPGKESMSHRMEVIGAFTKMKSKIVDTYLSDNPGGVITQCLKLKADFGPDALTPEIALLFALSLAREGMLLQAVSIGEGVVHELEVAPDLIHLKANMAELQLKAGEREKARYIYEKLTDTLDEQAAVLSSLRKKIEQTPKTVPKIEKMSGQHQTRPEQVPQVKGTGEWLFREVEQLVREQRFNEARDLLVSKRYEVQSEPEIEAIEEAMKDVELAEEKFIEKKIAILSARKNVLESARRFLEKEQFEDAIASLDTLEPEEEDSHEIRKLREQAIEKLINRERNRAAKLFLAAKDTKDTAKKEQYLLSSYEILKGLIDKYPSSPLNAKLKNNMAKVVKELGKL